jgi:hypothetical protein
MALEVSKRSVQISPKLVTDNKSRVFCDPTFQKISALQRCSVDFTRTDLCCEAHVNLSRKGCSLASAVSMTTQAAARAENTVTTGTNSRPSSRKGTEVTKESEKPVKLGRNRSFVWRCISGAPASKTSNQV